jgi:hypothetical protein
LLDRFPGLSGHRFEIALKCPDPNLLASHLGEDILAGAATGNGSQDHQAESIAIPHPTKPITKATYLVLLEELRHPEECR